MGWTAAAFTPAPAKDTDERSESDPDTARRMELKMSGEWPDPLDGGDLDFAGKTPTATRRWEAASASASASASCDGEAWRWRRAPIFER